MPTISERGERMPQSPIRKLTPLANAAKKRGIHVYHLNIGQPDLPTPQVALDAIKNIDRTVLEYSPSQGFLSYREKLVKYYAKYKINVNADDIIITSGGSEAVLFAFLSCLNPGDEIIVPEPAYANYMAFAVAAGAVIRTIATTIEEGFSLPKVEKFEELINDRTRAILICNPNNPTGYLYTRREMNQIRDLVKKYVSDPLSGPLKKVMQNRDKFYAVAGKEVVDYKLDNSIMGATMALTHWRPGMGQTFDEKRNEELIGYLLSVDYAGVPAALAQLYTAAYIRKGDFRGLLDKMKEVLSYNMFRSGADLNYFQNNIEALTLCDDKALVEEGIKWIDEVCAVTPDFFSKANLMNSKARLQTKIGDTLGADKSKMEEEKYNKEGEKRSGGKVFRAMRMN